MLKQVDVIRHVFSISANSSIFVLNYFILAFRLRDLIGQIYF